MSLKIRMRQHGRTNRQTYRLVVTDIRAPRDGQYLEMLGWYNPFAKENNCMVDADRLTYWLGLGAELSPNVRSLLVRVAPSVAKELQEKENARRVKNAAKRRALRKK